MRGWQLGRARAGLVALGAGLTLFGSGLASAATIDVDVTPGDQKGWVFFQETATGSGELVNGPATPPLGNGSARLQVNGTGGMALGTNAFAGTRFDEITELEYSTYRASGSSALAISLQFGVDYDLEDSNTSFQGRLVFEPYLTGSPASNIWQTWSPRNGKWWATGAPGSALCPQNNPCSWSQVLSTWPDAGIHASSTLGVVLFKAGGGWASGFDGNVDAFTFEADGDKTIVNFEAQPTDKDQCKNDGWRAFSNPEFKSQGACVSFVERERD